MEVVVMAAAAAAAVETAAAPAPSPAAFALPPTTTGTLSAACDPAHHLPAPAMEKAARLAAMSADVDAVGRTPVRSGTPAAATTTAAAAGPVATDDTDDPVLETSGLEQQLRSMLSAAAGNSGGSGGSGGGGTAAGDLSGGVQPPRSRRRLRPSAWGARPTGRPLPRLPSQQEGKGLSAGSEAAAPTPTSSSALGCTNTCSSVSRSEQHRGQEAADEEEGGGEGGEHEREGEKRRRTEAADGMASRGGCLSDAGLSSRSKSPSRLLHPAGVECEEEAIALTGGEGEDGGGDGENLDRSGRGRRTGAFYRLPGAENRNHRVERGGGGGALAGLRNGHDSRCTLDKLPDGERDGVGVEGVLSAGRENEPPGSRDRVVSVFCVFISERRWLAVSSLSSRRSVSSIFCRALPPSGAFTSVAAPRAMMPARKA